MSATEGVASARNLTVAFSWSDPRVYRTLAAVLIAGLFVVAAEQAVGWRSIVYPWLFIDRPLLIAGAAGLVGLSYGLRAVRLYSYLRLRRGLGLCLRLMLQHNLLVNLLPFRTGEFAFPVLMNRYFAIPAKESVPALLWLRVLDLHVLMLLLVASIGIVLRQPWVLLGAAVWATSIFAVFTGSRRMSALLSGASGRIGHALGQALAAVPSRFYDFVEGWLLTLANWLLKLVVFALIIELFAAVEFDVSMLGALGGELTAILPVHGIAGVGTYEAGVVAAMTAYGVSLNDALTGAVNLHLFMLGVSLLGGVGSLLIPLNRRRRDEGRQRATSSS